MYVDDVDPSFTLDFGEGGRLYYKGYVKVKKEGKFMATLMAAKPYWAVLKGTELSLFKDHKVSTDCCCPIDEFCCTNVIFV